MKKGFTLIELLAVIVILGIILAIAIPSVVGIIENMEHSALDADANMIAKRLQQAYVSGEIDITTFTKDDLAKINIDGSKYDGFGIEIINGKVAVTIAKGNYLTGNSLGSKVYGVTFSGTSSSGTRTDDAVGLNVTVNASTIDSDFDNAEIYGEIEDNVTDSYGNVFVKIPKFWIKKEKNGVSWTYKVSKTKQDSDYYLPACFYDEASGKILPYLLVGKYNASLNSGRLESKSGKVPLVSADINTFRNYAKANNSGSNQGYQLIDIHTIDMLQTLFYIEFATLDSQSVMRGFTTGQYSESHTISAVSGTTLTLPAGVAANYKVGQMIDIGTSLGGRQIARNLKITNVNTTNNTITYQVVSGISETPGAIATGQIVYNVGYLNGTTDTVSSASGSPTSNSDGKYAMKYRGIENLYGNIWQFIDGINIKDNQSYVARDASLYQSDKFDGAYQPLSYVNAKSNGYVVEMGYDKSNPFIQLPILTTGTSYYQDYYYQNTGNRIALFGGRWNFGTDAGAASWALDTSSSDASINRGSRLLKTPL